jgi:hypothetical protein
LRSIFYVPKCHANVSFCAYNHKRPLDPVSPEDFKRACERLSELKDCVLRQRTMSSGAVIMEHVSVHAHARQRQKELAEFAGAKERGGQGVSADEVRAVRCFEFHVAGSRVGFLPRNVLRCMQLFKSRGERSSFVLALEELKEAEQQGYWHFISTACVSRPSPIVFANAPPFFSAFCCVTTACKACAFTRMFGRRSRVAVTLLCSTAQWFAVVAMLYKVVVCLEHLWFWLLLCAAVLMLVKFVNRAHSFIQTLSLSLT